MSDNQRQPYPTFYVDPKLNSGCTTAFCQGGGLPRKVF